MAFQREQRMTEIDWALQATMRVKTAASLHIREALEILGFQLR